MNATRPAEIVRRLEMIGATDAVLLARFAATQDAGAFAELVRRHGPVVLGVCRRVTGHAQDAEDAFQATFLLLAKKAASLSEPTLLGNWLYGVAYRVARNARRSAARRRAKEVQVSTMPEPHAAAPAALSELTPILDEELAALPACYRDAIVLCDLRGVSREEAAKTLGIPEGTLSSRLANGRKKLAARLTKRGISLSVTALPATVTSIQAAITIPTELVTKTCGLVTNWAASGAVPVALARLIEGGFAVQKSLMFGAVMAFAVTGVVFAARPGDESPATPPAAAQKPEAVPQPKEEAKAAVAFTSMPKMRQMFVLPYTSYPRFPEVMWNSSGTHLALLGDVNSATGQKPGTAFSIHSIEDPKNSRNSLLGYVNMRSSLVGIDPTGSKVVTALREYGFISGLHQISEWSFFEYADGTRLMSKYKSETVDLSLPETSDYAFARNLKKFRTSTVSYDKTVGTKMEVLEVDARTGKSIKSLLKVERKGTSVWSKLAPNGDRFAVMDEERLTVYDLEGGAKISEHFFEKKSTANPIANGVLELPRMAFSRDGQLLVVARDIDHTLVLNTDTGKELVALEGLKEYATLPRPNAFAVEGHLLALSCIRKSDAIHGKPSAIAEYRLIVWETQTGKVLKSWDTGRSLCAVSFNPAKPLLAIFEPNDGNQTRVGFWDFAAEVEKK